MNRVADLSPGGQMILRRLQKPGTLLCSRIGPLKLALEGLIDRGLVERFAPGAAQAKTAIRLTDAGRKLIKKDAPDGQ